MCNSQFLFFIQDFVWFSLKSVNFSKNLFNFLVYFLFMTFFGRIRDPGDWIGSKFIKKNSDPAGSGSATLLSIPLLSRAHWGSLAWPHCLHPPQSSPLLLHASLIEKSQKAQTTSCLFFLDILTLWVEPKNIY